MRKTRIGKRGASKVPCRQSGLGYDRPERREDVPGRGKGPAGKGERCKRRTAAERPWLCPAREAGGWAGQREGPGRKGGILQAAHGGRAALAVPGPRDGRMCRAEGRVRQERGTLQAAHGGRAALAMPGPRDERMCRAEGRARQRTHPRCRTLLFYARLGMGTSTATSAS